MRKKVLILCYDFPPLNSAGALRPFSWYKELYKHNIYPIIITRNWSEGINNNAQKFSAIETKSTIIKTDYGTIIKSAFKPDLKSRLIAKYGFSRYSLLRKFLSARNLFLGPFIQKFNEYHFIYKEAFKYLSQEDVDLIIATGSPFGLFKQAHILSKKFNTKWMADYRDPFTYNWSIKKSKIQQLNELFKIYLERKWTKNVVHFTSASAPFVDLIGRVISKKGTVIRNGFDSNLIPETNFSKDKEFTVSFIGTVYDSESLNVLEKGIEYFLNSPGINTEKVRFQFVGIELNHTKGTDRILKLKERFSNNIVIIPSCSNQEALLIAAHSGVLLFLNYSRIADGVIPVKLYEYLALNKPIINIELKDENERGEFSEYLSFASNQEKFADFLQKMYGKWELNEPLQNKVPNEAISMYTRSHQTKLLAELIFKLV